MAGHQVSLDFVHVVANLQMNDQFSGWKVKFWMSMINFRRAAIKFWRSMINYWRRAIIFSSWAINFKWLCINFLHWSINFGRWANYFLGWKIKFCMKFLTSGKYLVSLARRAASTRSVLENRKYTLTLSLVSSKNSNTFNRSGIASRPEDGVGFCSDKSCSSCLHPL